jgi:hypothetical protein
MNPEQLGLIVCKHVLLRTKAVEGPYPANPADDCEADAVYLWNVDGRMLGTTYWGGPGLGSNAWKDADVVFLFDDFYLPRRTFIGQTQGHRLAPTSEGPLAGMGTLKTKRHEVDWISEGHILRWIRQMALRGKGRQFDERGVCSEQKVVITGGNGSLERLVLHKDELFPHAKLTMAYNGDLSECDYRDRLLMVLSDPALPPEVNTRNVGELMGVAWRDVSSDVMTPDTHDMLKGLGWAYVSRRGVHGSLFRRLTPDGRAVP